MKYKQVNVYTGYNENGIQSVFEFEHASDLASAAELVKDNIWSGMFNDLPDDADNAAWERTEQHLQEFYSGVIIANGLAQVGNGEENVMLVIPQGHPWYDRVEEDQVAWDQATCEAWEALVWCESVGVV